MSAIAQIALASCFLGICAQIKIPLYFTPIPLTLQTFGVMFVGAFLGSRRGPLAVLCYLVQGAIGLPVWAGGAASGLAQFIGPTGGYLMAYIGQAYLIGRLLEGQTNPIRIFAALLLAVCLQLGFGSLWLAQFVGIDQCFALGFYPFVLGDATKALFVAICVIYPFHLKGTQQD